MFGGKFDYAKEYAKYKPEQDTQFENYVDATPGLASVWDEIQSDPTGTQGSYWTQRGATSKADFGRSHAAEDAALRSGTYHGGKSGRTDYMPGTEAWKTLFPGDDPRTTFEDWQAGAGAGAGDDAGGWATARGGGAPGSANYPMGLVDYQEPSAMSGIPLDFQPWLQPEHIPDSLWNYQAPTLNEWEVERDWDWATKPASEYLTDEQKAAKDAAVVAQIRGDRNIDDPNYIGGSGYQQWDYVDPSEESSTAFTMGELEAMQRAAAESAALAEATMGTTTPTSSTPNIGSMI